MAIAEPPRVGRATSAAAGVRRRFSVDEFHRMAEAGILAREEHVELIEGELVMMSPMGSRHAAGVSRLSALLLPPLLGRALVRVQLPIRLDPRTEPEPDLAVARPRPDHFASEHPGAVDLLLLIEVMETSAPFDRGEKLELYARHNIPEVWLVDLIGEAVEVYRNPSGGRYTEIRIAPRGQEVAPSAFPDLALAVDAILG